MPALAVAANHMAILPGISFAAVNAALALLTHRTKTEAITAPSAATVTAMGLNWTHLRRQPRTRAMLACATVRLAMLELGLARRVWLASIST